MAPLSAWSQAPLQTKQTLKFNLSTLECVVQLAMLPKSVTPWKPRQALALVSMAARPGAGNQGKRLPWFRCPLFSQNAKTKLRKITSGFTKCEKSKSRNQGKRLPWFRGRSARSWKPRQALALVPWSGFFTKCENQAAKDHVRFYKM